MPYFGKEALFPISNFLRSGSGVAGVADARIQAACESLATAKVPVTPSKLIPASRPNAGLKQPDSGEINADGAADHVESRHGFNR